MILPPLCHNVEYFGPIYKITWPRAKALALYNPFTAKITSGVLER
jgi:hypothetical protein